MSIKSRRLFAILVITAMVLTMLPMTAFAADYSYAASYVEVNKTSVRVDSATDIDDLDNYVTFTVVLLNSSGNYVTGNIDDLYIKSSRDAETVAYQIEEDGEWNIIPTGIDSATGALLANAYANEYGEVKVRVWSGLAGSAKISFHKGTTGSEEDEKAGSLIDEETITFTTGVTKAKTVELSIDEDISEEEGNEFPCVGDEITLRARVKDENGRAVEGVTVTFQKSYKDGSWQTISSKDTNRQGIATLKVVENEAGKYEFRARVSGVTPGDDPDEDADVVYVMYHARKPVVLEKVTADGTLIAVGEDYDVKFKMKDYLGNACTDYDLLTLEVIEAPSDSALEDDIVDRKTGNEVDSSNNIVFTFNPDEPGTYKLRAEVEDSGLRQTLTLEAKEFGTVSEVKVELEKDRNSLRAFDVDDDQPRDSMVLTVKLLDENGVEIKTTDDSAVRLASSNHVLVAIDGEEFGKILGPVKADRKGVAVVTATHLDTGISGSVEVPVVGGPSAIDVDVSYSDLTAEVTMQVVDSDGNATYFSNTADVDYNIVASGVTVSNPSKFKKGTGKATFTASVDEYDIYKVTVVTHNGYSKTFDLQFKEAVETGAGSVTMFIGSTSYVGDGKPGSMDVAPFIQDGRTFVPVRFIAEAFGAEADWTPKDAPTEVVTLTRDDIQITINIGSYTIEVVRDGVAETVTSDVAAFIKDGRTFLPFRVIAEAFGAEVDWGPKEGPTEWVSFSQ